MMNFQNIVSFIVLKSGLHPLSGLASKLQKRDQDILIAYNKINDVVADIQEIRDDMLRRSLTFGTRLQKRSRK